MNPLAIGWLGMIGAALIIVTAGLAVAIGAGIVPWSYWWLLPSGIPAAFGVVLWICTPFLPD